MDTKTFFFLTPSLVIEFFAIPFLSFVAIWVLSQFEILILVRIRVFEYGHSLGVKVFSQFDFFSSVTILVSIFLFTILVLEFCQQKKSLFSPL